MVILLPFRFSFWNGDEAWEKEHELKVKRTQLYIILYHFLAVIHLPNFLNILSLGSFIYKYKIIRNYDFRGINLAEVHMMNSRDKRLSE